MADDEPSKSVMENMRRAFTKGAGIAPGAATPPHSDGKPPEPRRGFSMSRDDAIFWIGIAAFGDGLYLMADHPSYGVPLIIIGVALLAWASRGHMPRPPFRLA